MKASRVWPRIQVSGSRGALLLGSCAAPCPACCGGDAGGGTPCCCGGGGGCSGGCAASRRRRTVLHGRLGTAKPAEPPGGRKPGTALALACSRGRDCSAPASSSTAAVPSCQCHCRRSRCCCAVPPAGQATDACIAPSGAACFECKCCGAAYVTRCSRQAWHRRRCVTAGARSATVLCR